MGNALWSAVSDAFSNMLTLVGSFLTALIQPGADGPNLSALLPLFAIGIAISCILVAVKIVRKVTWGS